MYKYLRYILLGGMLILSGVTVAGLLSSKQPETTSFKNTIIQSFSKKQADTNPLVFTSSIILGGDIMLSRTIGADNKKQGYNRIFSGSNYNPIYQIPACKNGGCLLLMNLESPFSPKDNDVKQKTFQFKSNTGNIVVLEALRGGNSMVLNLANNHVNNAGGQGISTTRSLLDTHGFYHVGAGESNDQAKEILTFKHNNITRCIGGYSYEGNGGIYGGKTLYRNKENLSGMIADLQIMKTQLHCDIKAMMLHRGREYSMTPNKEQITQAHTLIDNGLDIIIGGHPHVPQTIELYNGKYIFYSLGNALFDQDWGMASIQKGMDTIYDDVLGKQTVPTYITMFPELIATKNSSGTTLSMINIHTARLEKGLFSPNDDKTRHNLLDKIVSNDIFDKK